ncbi:MAG: PQQ-dependent sugar dehydrogenase, partial [Kiloniellales bacterium]|nr:PQQ-dependent sugar dehydrogenase [Kiloniellales bacterium]
MHSSLSKPVLLISLIVCTIATSVYAEDLVTAVPAFPKLRFDRPTDLQHAPNEPGYLYLVEQAGRILVFENKRGVAKKAVFLDIRDQVLNDHREEGLLGLAFHPQYKENGYIYVNYTAADPRRTVIARFTRTKRHQADPGSEKIIISFPQPYGNHNGGQLAFGPDGFLYIATGDGGSGGDPYEHAQNRKTLLGKILRIDVHPA